MIRKQKNARVNEYTQLDNTLYVTEAGVLACSICCVVVNSSRKSLVHQHLRTMKHIENKERIDEERKIKPLALVKKGVKEILFDGFTGANIPLYKLRSPAIEKMFNELNINIPSETTVRNEIDRKIEIQKDRIKWELKGKCFYIQVDETQLFSKKYINIIIGTCVTPNNKFLVEVKIISNAVNNKEIVFAVDDIIKEYDLKRSDFRLLLSDAAPYMILAADHLKNIYPNMMSITCFAHLLHNSVFKIKNKYNHVDKLIATMKLLVHKNQTRKLQFKEVGAIPEPIITRWGTWLSAAVFYAENFTFVQEKIKQMNEPGLLFSKASEAINHDEVKKELEEIYEKYAHLEKTIYEVVREDFSIAEAAELVKKLSFRNDDIGLEKYIEKRMDAVDYKEIDKINDIKIKVLLKNCPCTTISIERSFSMLGKVVTKDKTFLPKNTKAYMMLYYNKFN